MIWFDTPKNMTPAYAREFVRIVRNLRPQTIINSRLMYSGRVVAHLDKARLDELRDIGVDYLSYGDRQIPANPVPGWHWETCMTLNRSWGYTADDHDWKTPATVIHQLVEVTSKGGNFLLNFGPTAEGELPAESMKIMKPVGAWLRVNGESIYGAGPVSLKGAAPAKKTTRAPKTPKARKATAKKGNAKSSASDWLVTGRPGKIYIHLFKWPAGPFVLPGVEEHVTEAYLLADPTRKPLKFTQTGNSLSVHLPKKAPDDKDSVVCLVLK